MERLKVYHRDRCRGEAMIERDEGRAEIRVTMEDPADGLYRAVLMGNRGQMTLGVLDPKNGKLMLRRRPDWRDVERLGELRSVQVSCSFAFRKKGIWQKTEQPADLVGSAFLKERLACQPCGWWRKEDGQLRLALPLETGRPFPLEALFCFGRIDIVEGQKCVVYTFDGNDMPL